jgi:hypothetical protein
MVALLWGLGWSTARAADACSGPYTVDAMVEDLTSVETFLRNNDDANASSAAEHMRAGIPCMTELMPRMIVGRAMRAVGGGLVAGGSDDGVDWLRTAAEIEQAFDYGLEDLPEVHKVRDAYADAKSTSGGEEVVVPNATLAGGTVYLDGRKITEPKARMDRVHVVQLDTGAGIKSWVVEGNAFPDAVLASSAPPVVASSGKKPKPAPAPAPAKPQPVASAPKPQPVASAPKPAPAPRPQPSVSMPKPVPTSSNGSVLVQRDRPWEKTPLMIGGGAIVAASGAVYYASIASHKKFVNANDDDVLVDLQSQTNRLVVATWAILGVGAGTLTWGVILDGEGGPLPAMRFRF